MADKEIQVDKQFTDRWSPRAFSSEPIEEATIKSLFEAARFAPSSYNEQPWRFVYAYKPEDLAKFRPLLMDMNRLWADKAPILIFVLAKKKFTMNGEENFHGRFDAGAAWMSLALQARSLGLYTHAMGGIHYDKVQEVLGIPADEYEVICGIAAGKIGDASELPDKYKEIEGPSPRKPLNEIAFEGSFKK